MKRRMISLILTALLVVQVLIIPASANSAHTYYSQYGYTDKSGKPLGDSLCYLAAFAMVITDLGKPITPVDVYYANGKTNTANFYNLAQIYGVTYRHYPLTGKTGNEKKQTIINVLNSQKYPAGFLVCTVVNGKQHMIVARSVQGGDVKFDCPANGCCIPLSKTGHSPNWTNVTSYFAFTPNENWSIAGNNNQPHTHVKGKFQFFEALHPHYNYYKCTICGENFTDGTTAYSSSCAECNAPSSTESGTWIVTIPANYKVDLYMDSTSTSRNLWLSAKSKAYPVKCTQKAVLPDGTVRYFAALDNGKSPRWFTFAGGMTVLDDNATINEKNDTITITFDANGGTVSQSSMTIAQGDLLPDLPTATRSGYTFDGWYNTRSGGRQVQAYSRLSESQTLYAHWNKDAKTYTIVFDANGGVVSPRIKTVTKGFPYGELPTPTYDGFTFLGWYTGKTKITASSVYDLDRDITLYAQWERGIQEDIQIPPESSLKVQGLSVSISQKGLIPQYTITSNYPINYVSYAFCDPDGYTIMAGGPSFNPDYKVYKDDDGGLIHPFMQFMEANREYSFTIEVSDESGKKIVDTATFTMPFSTNGNGEIIS